MARVAWALKGMGCYEVSLGDTIGQGTPERVTEMLEAEGFETGIDAEALADAARFAQGLKGG